MISAGFMTVIGFGCFEKERFHTTEKIFSDGIRLNSWCEIFRYFLRFFYQSGGILLVGTNGEDSDKTKKRLKNSEQEKSEIRSRK